jgi:hypothetical protein
MPVRAQQSLLLRLGGRLHVDFDQLSQMRKRLKFRTGNKIVQRDRIALLMNALAQRDQAGARLHRFENFNHRRFSRQTQVDSIAQQALIEVHKGFLAAQNVIETNRQKGARDHVLSRGGSLGAVEFIVRRIGAI